MIRSILIVKENFKGRNILFQKSILLQKMLLKRVGFAKNKLINLEKWHIKEMKIHIHTRHFQRANNVNLLSNLFE